MIRRKQANTQNLELTWVLQAKKQAKYPKPRADMGIAGEKATKYPKPRADMGIAGEKVSKYPKYKANMGITRKKQANTQNIATAWVCQTEKSPHTHSETQHGYGEEKSCHIPTNIESERV